MLIFSGNVAWEAAASEKKGQKGESGLRSEFFAERGREGGGGREEGREGGRRSERERGRENGGCFLLA